jgi:hypothetical protein
MTKALIMPKFSKGSLEFRFIKAFLKMEIFSRIVEGFCQFFGAWPQKFFCFFVPSLF